MKLISSFCHTRQQMWLKGIIRVVIFSIIICEELRSVSQQIPVKTCISSFIYCTVRKYEAHSTSSQRLEKTRSSRISQKKPRSSFSSKRVLCFLIGSWESFLFEGNYLWTLSTVVLFHGEDRWWTRYRWSAQHKGQSGTVDYFLKCAASRRLCWNYQLKHETFLTVLMSCHMDNGLKCPVATNACASLFDVFKKIAGHSPLLVVSRPGVGSIDLIAIFSQISLCLFMRRFLRACARKFATRVTRWTFGYLTLTNNYLGNPCKYDIMAKKYQFTD